MPCACLASLNNLLAMMVGLPSLSPGMSLSQSASLGLSAASALSASAAPDLSAAKSLDASLAPSLDAGAMNNLALTANMALMANLALGIDLASPAAGFAIEELGASIPALAAMLAQLPLFMLPNLAACAQLGLAASLGMDLSMSASLSMSMSLSASISASLSASLSASFSAMMSASMACLPGLGIDLSLAPSVGMLAGAIPAINANLALLASVLSLISMPLLALAIAFFTPLELLISIFGFGILTPGFDFSAALSAAASASASMSASASASASMSMSAAASAGMSASAAASATAAASVCGSAAFSAALAGLIIVPPIVALFLPLLMLILSCLGLGLFPTTPCSMCFLNVKDSDYICAGLQGVTDVDNELGNNAAQLTRAEFLSGLKATAFDAKMSSRIKAAQARAVAKAQRIAGQNQDSGADSNQDSGATAGTAGANIADLSSNLGNLKSWLQGANRSKAAMQVAFAETSKLSNISMSDLLASSEFTEIANLSGMSADDLLNSSNSVDLANLSPKDINDLSGLSGEVKSSLIEKGVPLGSADTGSALETGSDGSGSGLGLNVDAFGLDKMGSQLKSAVDSGQNAADSGQKSGKSSDSKDSGKFSKSGLVAAGAVGAVGIGAMAAMALRNKEGKGGSADAGAGSDSSGSGEDGLENSGDGLGSGGDGASSGGDSTASGAGLGLGAAGMGGIAGAKGSGDDGPWHQRAKRKDPSRNVSEEMYAVGDPTVSPKQEQNEEESEIDESDWEEIKKGNTWHHRAKHDKSTELRPERPDDLNFEDIDVSSDLDDSSKKSES